MRATFQLTDAGLVYRLEGEGGHLSEATLIEPGAEPVDYDAFALRLKQAQQTTRRDVVRQAAEARAATATPELAPEGT